MDEEYEELEEVKEAEIKVDSVIKEFAESTKTVIAGNSICSGCGDMIGLKIALQVLECVLVANGSVSRLGNYINANSVHGIQNAAAVAAGICRASGEKVLVYADANSTSSTLQSVVNAAKGGENFIYICYNNEPQKSFYQTLSSARYVATASVSHPEDYIRKLRKSSSISGFRFIELLSPCPVLWGYEPSNTVEVARLAVNSRAWPLIEMEDGRTDITVVPEKAENIENYLQMQKRFSGIRKEEISKIRELIDKNWKSIAKK